MVANNAAIRRHGSSFQVNMLGRNQYIPNRLVRAEAMGKLNHLIAATGAAHHLVLGRAPGLIYVDLEQSVTVCTDGAVPSARTVGHRRHGDSTLC